MSNSRPAAVAGLFYSGDAATLGHEVRALLAGVRQERPEPKALIAPHAGYIYSGPVAASAYAALAPLAARIRRVVLLGPAHRVPVQGLAASTHETFMTPLGAVPVDRAAIDRLTAEFAFVREADAVHADEHSLEVQLPFLQVALEEFSIVPLAVGEATDAEVEAVLAALWGGLETLIVISTDLSHYHDYATAQRLDRATCDAIERLAPAEIGYQQACGRTPLRGLLATARARGLTPLTLDLRNSGDTAGPRDQVVGYGAWLLPADG